MCCTTPKRSEARARRGGYTLVEMLIVCAVLAVLAGMSWPAMRSALGKGRLQAAADGLQTVLRKARLQAVRSGTPMLFRYQPGGRRYRVDSWGPVFGQESSGEIAAAQERDDSAPDGAVFPLAAVEKELPVGVRFGAPEIAAEDVDVAGPAVAAPLPVGGAGVASTGEAAAMEELAGEPGWSTPLPFQANGRSEDATIRLQDDRGFRIDVSLRGLTGVVKVTAAMRPAREEGVDFVPAADDRPASREIPEGGW